jgi:hypothetical protein
VKLWKLNWGENFHEREKKNIIKEWPAADEICDNTVEYIHENGRKIFNFFLRVAPVKPSLGILMSD